jgi:hypothetical protein
VQVSVRIAGAGRVVRDGHRLELLDGHLHLTAPGADPGGGVLCQPADDLDGRPVLGRVVGGGDVRMQRRGQRPGLRAVSHDLHESHRVFARDRADLGPAQAADLAAAEAARYAQLSVHLPRPSYSRRSAAPGIGR